MLAPSRLSLPPLLCLPSQFSHFIQASCKCNAACQNRGGAAAARRWGERRSSGETTKGRDLVIYDMLSGKMKEKNVKETKSSLLVIGRCV